MKDMFAMGRFLFVVAALAGILLAFTEAMTAPRIAENQRLAFEVARKAVLPGATAFRMLHLPEKTKDGKAATQTFSLGFDDKGVFLGTVQVVSPKGYGGAIDIALGLKSNLQVSDVQIQSQKETPGLGTKLESESFLAPFRSACKGMQGKVNFRVRKDGGDIDGITAATISSRAFCQGIRGGVSRAKSYFDAIKSEAAKGPPSSAELPSSEGKNQKPLEIPQPMPVQTPQGGGQ